jgi:hypothetical protein
LGETAQRQSHPDLATLMERVTSTYSAGVTDSAEGEAFLRRGLLLVDDPRTSMGGGAKQPRR